MILRFQLEVALVEGTLEVADVPGGLERRHARPARRERPDDARGCLQDIHWAFGELGYFPTYAIGNVMRAQLWAAIRDAGRRASTTRSPRATARPCATGWASTCTATAASSTRRSSLRRATGRSSTPRPLLEYLRAKYGALYELSSV